MEGRERNLGRSGERVSKQSIEQLEPWTLLFLPALPELLSNEELQVMSEEEVPSY